MWMKFLLLALFTNTVFAAKINWGEKIRIGNGFAQSYVKMSNMNMPLELGVALSHQALVTLPKMGSTLSLPMPRGVRVAPYENIVLKWNPRGHAPLNIYGKPHFDFNFFFIDRTERFGITCLGIDAAICTKPVTTPYLVAGYKPTPMGLARTGWLWLNHRSREFHGKPFTHTYVYGYYDAKPNVVTPMVTLDFLMTHKSIIHKVRLPSQFAEPGLYPSAYKVGFMPSSKLHIISLTKFERFQ